MKFTYASGSRPLDGFVIKRGVGRGGFGEVYFAVSDAGKEVALKRIERHLEMEMRGVRQCLNLKHTNLVSLFNIREDEGGEPWVVMEYINGDSLADVIDSNPHGMHLEEVDFWLIGILAGVKYLHDHGIVHRDLKPGNIFLDEDIVKIGDYGLAKFISCSQPGGQTESVGTLHYMAPEIGNGRYGKEIDVYALGVMLYEMLTGHVPFDGESSQEVMMKHLTAAPDLRGVPEPYCSVIARALEKDPKRRFADVSEMTANLGLATPASRLRGAAGGPVRLSKPSDNLPLVHAELVDAPAKAAGKKEDIYIGDEIYIGDDARSGDELYIGDDDVPLAQPGPRRGADQGMVFGQVKDAGPSPESRQAQPPPARPRPAYVRRPMPPEERKRASINGTLKAILLLALVCLVLVNAQFLAPICLVLGAVYLLYFGIRSATSMTVTAAAQPPQRVVGRRRPARRTDWRELARRDLRDKPREQRWTELTGSLLIAAAVSAVASFVILTVAGVRLDAPLTGGAIGAWSFFTWLTLCGAAGAWLILAASKLWEGEDGEPGVRRLTLLIVGLALGAAAFSLNEALLIEPQLQQWTSRPLLDGLISENMYAADGSGKLAAYLVYFAALLAVPRWWRQADPLRTSRLSLWSILVCGVWAWLVHLVWPFPQPLGFLLAGVIALSVQLSAPWMNRQQRSRVGINWQED